MFSLLTRQVEKESRYREGLLLIAGWLGMLYFLANYRVGDLEVFFIPTYVFVAVWITEGVAALADGGYSFLRAFHLNKRLCLLISTLIVLLVYTWAISPFWDNVQKSVEERRIAFLDESRIYYPYPVLDPDYPYREAKKIAGKVEDNAILFIDWNLLYPACYVTHVEQQRTGISCYEPMPFGTNGRMASSAIQFIRQNIDQRPIYFSFIPDDLKGLYKFKRVVVSTPLYKIESR